MIRPAAFALCLLGALSLAFADDNANIARTLDLYKRFTYKNVTSTEADRIFSDLGIPSTFNPRNKMQNPDPAWIPGWNSLQLTDETKTAIAQAAINRTWTAKVDDDYKRYRSAWAAIEKQFRPELERIRGLTGFYRKSSALAKLLDDVRARAEADKVLYPSGTVLATVGFVDDLVIAMVTVYRDAKLDVKVDEDLGKHGIARADFVAGGRPFADDATERDVFVAFSQDKGNLDTPALPRMAEYGHAYGAVRWPTTNKAAAAKQAVAKLVADAAKQLELPRAMPNVPSLFAGSLGEAADPTLRWVDPPVGGTDSFTPLLVTRVTKAGDTTVATLATTFDRSTPYACKDTKQLDTTGSGRLYVQDCKYKHTKTPHTLEVTFPELPEGVELAKGDQVALYADLVDEKRGKQAVTYKLTARLLASVKRDGKPIWPAPRT
ncbi:MAG TPA: hypothetical protein VFQ53_31820 [Kofleriaceae bacterium]|nr:hypothetical protein [Kofleriaceae bacterium]